MERPTSPPVPRRALPPGSSVMPAVGSARASDPPPSDRRRADGRAPGPGAGGRPAGRGAGPAATRMEGDAAATLRPRGRGGCGCLTCAAPAGAVRPPARPATRARRRPSAAHDLLASPPPRRPRQPRDVRTRRRRWTPALAGLDRRTRVAQLFVVGVRLDDLGAGDAAGRERSGRDLPRRPLPGLRGRPGRHRRRLAVRRARARVSGWPPTRRAGRCRPSRARASTRCPRPWSRARCRPTELAALADRLGASLDSAGVNLDLAPVADVVPAGHRAGQPPDRRLRPAVRQHRRRGRGGGRHGGRRAGRRTASPRRSSTSPDWAGCSGTPTRPPHVVDTVTTADDAQVAAFGSLAPLAGARRS